MKLELLQSVHKEAEPLLEVQNITAKELFKPHGKTGQPRTEILAQLIQSGQPLELAAGGTLTPDPKAPENQKLVQVLATDDPAQIKQYAWKNAQVPNRVIKATDGNFYAIPQLKKAGYFGGGREAGRADAASTAAAEALQAMAIAYSMKTRKPLRPEDITLQNFQKASDRFSIGGLDQAAAESIVNDKLWVRSMVNTTNTIRKNVKLAGMVMHHGSDWVRSLLTVFNKVNKNLKTGTREFPSKDKWNPADIWAVKPNVTVPQEINDLSELNAWLERMYDKGQVIGISLKKTPSASEVPTVKTYNHEKDVDDILDLTVNDLIVGKRNRLFGSKSSFIMYEGQEHELRDKMLTNMFEGSVVTRSFQSSEENVTSEIEGKFAAGGKMGFALINAILKAVGLPTLTDRKAIGQLINKKAKNKVERYKTVINNIIDNASTVNSSLAQTARENIEQVANERSWPFLVSKYQAVEFVAILKKASPKKRRDVLQRLVRYASSRSDLSSVFVKVW